MTEHVPVGPSAAPRVLGLLEAAPRHWEIPFQALEPARDGHRTST